MDSAATASMPVLCAYRLFYRCPHSDETRSVESTKMIHVARSRDIPLEFDAAMVEETRRGGFAWVDGRVTSWKLTVYRPFCGQPTF